MGAFRVCLFALAIMRGELEDTTSGGGHHASAEAEAQRLLAGIQEGTTR